MLPTAIDAKLRYEAPQADIVRIGTGDIVSNSIIALEDYAPEQQDYTAQHRF